MDQRARRVLAVLMVTMLLLAAGTVVGAQDATPAPATAITPYVPPPDLGSMGGAIKIDGSSTVFPISDEVRLRFEEIAGDVEIEANFRGTGGGFSLFCAGEIDIAAASRPIAADEETVCAEQNVRYYHVDVAFDGITVVVNPANDFASCLTVAQLQLLWRPDDPARTWQDLDPAWPDREIDLFGPGIDSGTFDFFTEAVVGEEDASRVDYYASENDHELVVGAADAEDSLGYFGYAYYLGNQDKLKAVAVDAGQGCVAPSAETIAGGQYAPLSRPLSLYVRTESLSRGTVREFLRFYLAEAKAVVPEVGYVPLADAAYAAQQAKLEAALAGAIPPDGPAALRGP